LRVVTQLSVIVDQYFDCANESLVFWCSFEKISFQKNITLTFERLIAEGRGFGILELF
jgi:hypothetical protein